MLLNAATNPIKMNILINQHTHYLLCRQANLHYFQVTNLSSPRNIAILGLSVFIGLMVPTWVKKVKTPFETGRPLKRMEKL